MPDPALGVQETDFGGIRQHPHFGQRGTYGTDFYFASKD
jgi:hypothetical protein